MTDFRIDHDSLGEVRVPATALWRAQTQRAIENFPISGTPIEPALIHALALIKQAAARVNHQLGVLDETKAAAVDAAASLIAQGLEDDQFPIDVFQTGSGTSSNMNMNEVIAGLAAQGGDDVHPNDHVNASQSSNDTFPTAIHVAAVLAVTSELKPSLDVLATSLEARASEYAEHVKAGRTHLMDATPVTLGQEFSGYAAIVRLAVERLDSVLPRVRELPLGGTAVGTGINTPPGFAAGVIEELNSLTGDRFTETRNHFEAQGGRDSLVELSGVLKTIAVGLTKVCNDLRWMSSGPTTGLAEIHLPDLQPGSSIMPGKVNPVLPEATLMVCAQVIGNDAAVTAGGAAGNFELNVMMPVIARNVLESIRLLATSTRLLAERCVDGITANPARMAAYAASSPSIVTPLNRYLGYETAAKVAKQALADGATIRETVISLGLVADGTITEEQLDQALDLKGMTHPVKTILITGATAGIGLESAHQLAAQGHHLVLVGRSPAKLESAAAAVRQAGSPQVDTLTCDLSDLAAVRRLAEQVRGTVEHLDVLVNNAGTVFDKRTLTPEGHEATFATNHLGGFLLTELLLDLMIASAPSRIVFTASGGHYQGTLDLDDLGYERGYSIMKAYSRSKLANVLYTRDLADRLAGTGVTVNCLHPGTVATDIWDGAPWFARPVLAVVKRLSMISPAQGGTRITYLATGPAVEGATGGYYDEDRLRTPSELAQDAELGHRLVEVSRELVGLA